MNVATADSLNQSMEKAVKHYSSLFMLPSYKKLLLLLAFACIVGEFLSTVILFPTLEGLINAAFMGISIFLATLLVDFAVAVLILRHDPIYDSRRTNGLSLFCWGLWFLFIFVGVALAKFSGISSWWIKLCLLGFSAVTILRLVVLFSTSSRGFARVIVASIVHPFACIMPFLAFWIGMGYPLTSLVYFFAFSFVVSLIASLLFVSALNSVGMRTLGMSSLPIFKAFLMDWIADLNAPFEDVLERLSENRNVDVSLIKFSSSKPKAVIIVPSVHPGPFKNIGSSLLPSMLKSTLEKELSCAVCVPHGLLGHEFDLASQVQNQKIIDRIVESVGFNVSEGKATPLIKVNNELATACCQVFGNFALLSFTLAPKTTEDLPQELGLFVHQEAEKYGLERSIVVNAHNSINGTENMPEALASLKEVAATCLKKAASLKQMPFEIGAASIIPKEYSLKDGMGPGGITVVVVKVGEHKTAYVVIDGNNMISGLREKILSALKSIEIDEGEVFTTDTHSVNAITLSIRGYHPVGETVDHKNLIDYIKNVTHTALSKLEHAKVGYYNTTVSDVKVIGEKKLEALCLLIDRALRKAKKTALPIFGVSGILLMLILMIV
jgi:putative membrane protein